MHFFKCGYAWQWLVFFFITKVGVGLLQYFLMLQFSFGGDAISFFNTGLYLNQIAFENPWLFIKVMSGLGFDVETVFTPQMYWTNADILFNDNQTMIRLHALLAFFSMCSYIVHTVWFSFLSLIGFVAMIKTMQLFFGKKLLHTLLLTCIPSTFFWCAGCSKEAVLIAFLGLFLWALANAIKQLRITFTLLGSCALLFLIKSYIALALIPALLSWCIAFYLKKNNWLTFAVVYAFTIIFLFTMPAFDFMGYLIFKQHSFQYLAEWSGAGSVLPLLEIKSPWLMVPNYLQALEHIFFRPHIFEIKNMQWLFAAIENYVLLLLLVVFVLGNQKFKGQSATCFLLFFTVSLFVLIGITTPVLGSLVRYKAPLMPLFFIALVWQFNYVVLKQRLNYLFSLIK
ncbi:MAG: hypothetical protein JNK61_06420 [Bacteroidia bacterium]|nr:hypothetical protein [Bacteroidia bacterium]